MIDPEQDMQKLTLGQLLAQVPRLVGGRMRQKMGCAMLHRLLVKVRRQLAPQMVSDGQVDSAEWPRCRTDAEEPR